MRQFVALVKRRDSIDELADYRSAIMPWIYMSINRTPNAPSLTLDGFMRQYMPWSKRSRKTQTPEDMQTMIIALNAALGGEVIECRE